MTHFPTLEEAHAYCLSDQSRRSPMPPIFEIPSKTSAMAVRYVYPAPPSVPSQTSHTSSPSLSSLPAASGNSCPSRKKCDYCGEWGHLKTTCHALHGRPAGYQPRPSQSSTHLSVDSSVYTRRHLGCQPPIPDCQTSSVVPSLPPAIDSPLSGIEPSPTASIPVTTDDDSHVSHSDDDRPIAIWKEKRNARKPDRYSDTAVYSIVDYTSDHRLSSTYNFSYTENTVCVGLARLGSEDQTVVAGSMKDLLEVDFGAPLHCFVIGGDLHPLEEEMLNFYTLKKVWAGSSGFGKIVSFEFAAIVEIQHPKLSL
ncbi:hypothetical protein GIB67_003892 [Kingdonia uniflora]|uniref:Uncharacterized protein n=1 Tax=Kingdonia uniflora TaxID=39325 RepID=A0A7J7LJU4_9MAGN|nr:hypothetical protein GIB67_003892 [Kingdonia uniflora]